MQSSKREAKFRFNESVEVISGFYKGCKGRVLYYFEERELYSVEIDGCNGSPNPFDQDFREEELKRVK